MTNPAAAPLDLRELFATPWEGQGLIWRPWWARLLPAPSTFRFRSEIENLAADSWDVIDTTTFPDGTVQQRRMHSQQLADDQLRLTADDMPGGAGVRVRSDGFEFSPYVIHTPIIGRLRLPLRHFDAVKLEDGGTTMVDSIELRFLGLRVARVDIRLHRAPAAPS